MGYFFKIYSLIKSHRETIDAIIYRELKLRISKSRFGFLGLLIKPIAQIIIYGDVYYDWGWINSSYVIACAFPALSMSM